MAEFQARLMAERYKRAGWQNFTSQLDGRISSQLDDGTSKGSLMEKVASFD